MIKRVFDLLDQCKKFYIKKDVIFFKEGNKEVGISINKLIENVNMVSCFLLSKGIKKGDIVVTIAINCPDYNYFDFGIMQIGAIHVPLSPFINDEELKHILLETNTKFLFLTHKLLLLKFKKIIDETTLKPYIVIGESYNDYFSIQELLSGNFVKVNSKELSRIKFQIKPEDLATIAYTSGSSGIPKGVMISHFNLTQSFKIMTPYYMFKNNFKIISYLPLSALWERFVQYISIYSGMSIHYKDKDESLLESLKRIKPDVMIATPLILENLHGEILEKLEKFHVNSKIEKMKFLLGGHLKKIYGGGAILSKDISQFYWDMNVPIFDLYGASEFAATIAVNTEKDYKVGTVGKFVKGYEYKIEQDGELKVKGPSITQGYFKSPELTKLKIDKDGWYATGDIVELDNDGYVKIIGRKNIIIKLKSGVFFNIETVEHKFRSNPFIKNIMLICENKPFISALVMPNKEFILSWANKNEIKYVDFNDLIKNKIITDEFDNIFNRYNNNCHETENIKKYTMLENEFSVEGGELTPLLKVRRKFILEKYNTLISAFYEK